MLSLGFYNCCFQNRQNRLIDVIINRKEIPDVENTIIETFEKLNGPTDRTNLKNAAQDLMDVELCMHFPKNVVIIITMLQIIAKNENKRTDEHFLSAYKSCEIARLSTAYLNIMYDIDTITKKLNCI